jgi:hypothetical protein
VLRSRCSRTLLLCSRQSGKSTTAAALAVRELLLRPGALVLVLSPSLRQSGESYRKVVDLLNALGRPVRIVRETQLTLELANGSRVVSLPESEGNVRGYSGVRLLVVDEAARVSDGLYYAVRPMLAVSGGGLVALSTPFGTRGWFWEEWDRGSGWDRVKVPATACPRISPAFLEEERASLPAAWFDSEYLCEFRDAVDACFRAADIEAALRSDLQPLFAGPP